MSDFYNVFVDILFADVLVRRWVQNVINIITVLSKLRQPSIFLINRDWLKHITWLRFCAPRDKILPIPRVIVVVLTLVLSCTELLSGMAAVYQLKLKFESERNTVTFLDPETVVSLHYLPLINIIQRILPSRYLLLTADDIQTAVSGRQGMLCWTVKWEQFYRDVQMCTFCGKCWF